MHKPSFIIIGILFATTMFAVNNLSLKNISKIYVQNGEHNYQYSLNYDSQNRIISITPDNLEIFGITNFEYAGDSVRVFKGDMFVSCSINSQGYIDNTKYGDFPVLFIGNMFYNSLGQLTSIENQNLKMLFKWENDNMVTMNVQEEQIDLTYTEIENKNQFGLLLKIEEENCTPVFPYYSLLGKATKHLPASIGQGEEKISYNYKIDEDGFVTEITMIYPNNSKTVFYRFSYE
jgi:hypothetical protein